MSASASDAPAASGGASASSLKASSSSPLAANGDAMTDVDDASEHKSGEKREETHKQTAAESRASPTSSSGGGANDESSTDSEGEREEGGEEAADTTLLRFPAPSFPVASTSAALKHGRDAAAAETGAEWVQFRLPNTWIAHLGRGAAAKQPANKKSKTAAADEAKAKSADPATDAEKEKRRREREKERARIDAERAKEKAAYDRLLPEPGVSSAESFERLVRDVLNEGSEPPAALQPERAVQRLWEVPYLSHFTWLFQSPLHCRPIEPRSMEEMLLQPNSVLHETAFSELASKLLFSTRARYTPHYSRAMRYMQKGQRCFDYELISEHMFLLIEIWIEQHKARMQAQQGQAEEEEGEEGAEENGDEEEGGGRKRGGGGGKGGRKRKTPVPSDSDSELSDEDEEDEDERDAFNFAELPERKWSIDTMELFGNVNPFVGEDSSNSDAAANGSMTATAADAAAPAPAALPVRRKSFHQLSVEHRATILRLLCEYQLSVNPVFQQHVKSLESKELHVPPLGSDATGKLYYYFGFPDFRLYVQQRVEWIITPKSAEEVEAERREEEAFKRDVAAELARMQAELADKQRKEKAEQEEKARKKEEKAAKKKASLKAESMDEDAPLSLLVAPAAKSAPAPSAISVPPPAPDSPHKQKSLLAYWSVGSPAPASPARILPPSSLARLKAPNQPLLPADSPTKPAASAASNSNSNDTHATPRAAASNAASSAASSSAAAAAAAAPDSAAAAATPAEYPGGLPFALKPVDSSPPRAITFALPDAPRFSLLTTTPTQIESLLTRLRSVSHPRNTALVSAIESMLRELEEGRGRSLDDEEKKGKKKDAAAGPKRISDRLVTLEAAREEQERARLARLEQESRQRYTRRNQWLDKISQRNLAKLRRVYERMKGIDTGDKAASKKRRDDDDEEEEEDEEEEDDRSSRRKRSKASARGSRKRARSSRAAERSDTETEDEEEADEEEEEMEEDEGCAVCGTVEPPSDGSNPILLCDSCDKQLCLKCIPLDRVPDAEWFCDECAKSRA